MAAGLYEKYSPKFLEGNQLSSSVIRYMMRLGVGDVSFFLKLIHQMNPIYLMLKTGSIMY